MRKSIHTPEYTFVRDILRAVRREAGFSQRHIASRLRVTPSWIAKVETGERRVDIVEFMRILHACGANVSATLAQVAEVVPVANESPPQKRRRD